MVSVVAQLVEALGSELAHLETGALSGDDAAVLVDAFAQGERLCATGKALCAKRATEAAVHLRQGHRSGATWLANRTGDSLSQAASALSTAEAAESLPRLAEALRAGELSAERAAQVAGAAAVNPAAEAALVRLAKEASMKALRDRAAQVRASTGSTASESDRLEAIRRRRYLRHFTEPDGALRLDARLAPDDGAKVLAGIRRLADRLFCQARGAGVRESPQAYAADALVALVAAGPAPVQLNADADPDPQADPGDGQVRPATPGSAAPMQATPQAPPVQVVIRVDASALRRGYVEGDEICEIPGVGPVPVATARAALGDAWLRLVITDGVDIATVCHMGRNISAHLRSAIEERDRACVVPGCEVAHGLEIDHWRVDVADHGPTCLFNLARLCHHHHLLKTHQGYRLDGGPGRWSWIPPRRPAPATTARHSPVTGAHPSLFEMPGPGP